MDELVGGGVLSMETDEVCLGKKGLTTRSAGTVFPERVFTSGPVRAGMSSTYSPRRSSMPCFITRRSRV